MLREELRKILSEGPERVVFVVGSGVARGAVQGAECEAFASWEGLVRSGLERAHTLGKLSDEELADYTKQLGHARPRALVHVASVVEDTLGAPGHGEFRRWLRETVGTFEKNLRDRSALEALAEHQQRGALLATTNYDLLLEHVTGLGTVTWRDPSGIDRLLREPDGPQILHLHGAWRWPESVVLGIKTYSDVVRDEYARRVLAALRTDRTFVFVGYGTGLRAPTFKAFLEWTAEGFAGSEARHFRLCRDSREDAARAERPDGQRIFTLPYGPEHGDLAPFLRSLLPAVSRPRARVETSKPVSPPVSSREPPVPVRSSSSVSPAEPVSWDRALYLFLREAFKRSEIQQFFVHSLGRALADGLPSGEVSYDSFCFQTVELLLRHNACDHQFFEALRMVRAPRRSQIDAIQRACLGTLESPSPPPPPLLSTAAQDAIALPQFALVLDRTTQWLTLTTTLREEPRHVLAVVHGDNHQDIGLFIRRTLRWANGIMSERSPRAHEVVSVQCYHERHCPRSRATWDNRLAQALEGRGITAGRLNAALSELARRSAALLIFIGENNGGLRDGGAEGMKLHERNAFAEFLRGLVGILPADAPNPIRILVPIEHAPGDADDGLLEAARGASQMQPSLVYLPLQELDFPTWFEVRDSLRKEGQRRGHECKDRDIERLFRKTFNQHDALRNSQAHSFAALGKALGEILDRELPEDTA
jgi:hypothetical protein